MHTDPPAPDLGAIRALHYEAPWKYADSEQHPCYGCGLPWPCDASKVLAAYDAQAARLAAYRSVLEEVAADDDPKDGCAHADAAKTALEGAENWRKDAKMDDLSPESQARIEEAAKNRKAVRELWDLLKAGQREIHDLEARLAAAEAERDRQAELRAEWQAMAEEFRAIASTRSAERDQARADAADAMLAHGLAVEALRHVEAECKRDLAAAERRATRLAALEQAARAWADRDTLVYHAWEPESIALLATVANLDAPPGESA